MHRLLTVLFLASLAQAGETYLVVAGVEQYDDPGLAPLRYTIADVTAVAEVFRAAGVPERNLTVLATDRADALQRPTQANVLRALQTVRERAVTGDTVIFMFSGHGLQKADESYLLTVESNRQLVERTALAMSSVNEILRGLQASHLLFLIDACRNDPDSGRSDANAALNESFAKGMRPKVVADAAGQVPQAAVLLACDVGERAWENPGEGHGAFTWALLNGLRGQAADHEGAVRLSRLAAYVAGAVKSWTARARRRQTPKLDNPGGADFVLLKTGAPAPAAPPAAPAAPAAPGSRPRGWPESLKDYQPPAGLSWSSYRVSPTDGMPQVLIPAGEFPMGSPADEAGRQEDEGPVKRVFVSAFWMDLHEVTVAQYRRFCAATGRASDTQGTPDDGRPVQGVPWSDAAAYAVWAGRQLPTEAQWEKAARGGTSTAYPWGPRWSATRANGRDGGPQRPTPPGSYAPNGYGLYDLAGNVWEWCRDWYDETWYARMPDRDPENTDQGRARVCRGGSWYYASSSLRAAERNWGRPDDHYADVGFRCVQAP